MFDLVNFCTGQEALQHPAAAMCGCACGCFLTYPIATPATAWLLLGLKPPASFA